MFELNCGFRQKRTLRFDVRPYPEGDLLGYEPEVVDVMEHFLEPGDIFVDAGASIGFHTCLASHLVGENGWVYAFEPHAKSFVLLDRHAAINGMGNVRPLPVALWKEDCPRMDLWSIDALGYSSLHPYVDELTKSEVVPAVAIDTLPIGHPRMIKIDTEGSELEVLRGANETLARSVDCVVVELNYEVMAKMDRTDRMMREYMAILGYDMFLINIADGEGHYGKPVVVPLDQMLVLRGGFHINVMFSTQQKVAQRW